MTIRSFSKINLSLNVNKKLRSGLHDIQSFFCQVDLSDQIIIKKIDKKQDNIKFIGKFAKHINKKKNSIYNVLKVLRSENIITNHYSVLINKKIPVFAGLGGGTSNAAYLAKYLTKNKFEKNLLNILEKKIGTDFKLFLYNQGFLQNLKSVKVLKKKYKLFFLLIYPNIKSSTQSAYLNIADYTPKLNFKFNNINNKRNFIKFLKKRNNDFQSIIERRYPIIKKLLKEIRVKKGCYFSRMTGSGSVCYGMFENEKSAKAALLIIKSKYPKFWISVTKTI